MVWLWIPNLLAAAALIWGVRRMYRNHLRQRTGGRARHRELARVAVATGACWFPIFALILITMLPIRQAAQRRAAIAELRAMGAKIPDHGGHIDLRDTFVTDEDMELLLDIPELSEVDLSETGITDAGARCLASMPRLQTFHLCGTAVSVEMRERISDHASRVKQVMESRLAAQEARQRELEEKRKAEAEELKLVGERGELKVETDRYEKAVEEKRRNLEAVGPGVR